MSILIIFGDKTAEEVLEAAKLGYGDQFDEIRKLYFERESFLSQHLPDISGRFRDVYYHVGVANVRIKHEIDEQVEELGWKRFTIVHPSAVISPSARIGTGVFVGPLAVISSKATIGDHGIVHIHASVGHDVEIGECCAILPGARISGSVTMGDRVLIGSNAFLAAGIRIGDDCQVDALTYVRRDLEPGYLASVRTRKPVKRLDIAKPC